MSRLYFLIGISGSGKSSYIKSHFIPEVVVSPDDLRRKFTGDVSNHTQEGKVWAVVPKLLQKHLDQYGKAVLDATNVDSGARAGLLNKFPRDIVERIAVVFEIDPEVAKQRVKDDIASGKDRSDVPDDVIDKQYEKFKRGYNSIKQQFDKVIDGNKGRSLMKKEDIKKIQKIVNEEMKKILEQDYDSALEKASYQAYQDMYLVPQSNWRLKKSAPMIDSKGREYPGKIGEIHKIQAVEYDFLHTGEVVTECGDETYSVDAEDFRNSFELLGDEEGLKVNNESVIREEVKKLSKIKDYFGKNIKDSIERLEEAFLIEENDTKFNKGDMIKFTHDMANLHVSKGDKIEIISDELPGTFTNVPIYKIKNLRNNKIYTIEKTLLQAAFNKNYAHMSDYDREPEDAYLDQDFEDRISGDGYEMDENAYLKGKYGDTIKIKANLPFYLELNLNNESDIKKVDVVLQKYGFKFIGKTKGTYWSWHWYYGGKEYPRGYYRLTGDIQRDYIEMEEIHV